MVLFYSWAIVHLPDTMGHQARSPALNMGYLFKLFANAIHIHSNITRSVLFTLQNWTLGTCLMGTSHRCVIENGEMKLGLTWNLYLCPLVSIGMNIFMDINKRIHNLTHWWFLEPTLWLAGKICPLVAYPYNGMNITGVTHNILIRFKSGSAKQISCLTPQTDLGICGNCYLILNESYGYYYW